VALAILTVRRGYVLQHRDDLPTLPWPGHWSLFGGGVEPGERPIEAIRREIREELTLDVPAWVELWTFVNYSPFWDRLYRCTTFVADVTDLWDTHVLGEGQGAGVFPVEALPSPIVPMTSALLERYDDSSRRRRSRGVARGRAGRRRGLASPRR